MLHYIIGRSQRGALATWKCLVTPLDQSPLISRPGLPVLPPSLRSPPAADPTLPTVLLRTASARLSRSVSRARIAVPAPAPASWRVAARTAVPVRGAVPVGLGPVWERRRRDDSAP